MNHSWNTFASFKTYVSALPTTVEKGNYFAVFSMFMLKYYPIFNYNIEELYMYKDFPENEKKAYFLHLQDKGTDLVIQKKASYTTIGEDQRPNKYLAVQCKFLTDEAYCYSDKGLATFLDDATRLRGGVYISTQEKYTDFKGSENLSQRPLTQICMPDIRRLEEKYPELMSQVFDATWAYLNQMNQVYQPKNYNDKLRPYQELCIDKSIQYFGTNNKGQLTMATGSGKTICARNIVERNLNPSKSKHRIVWVVPKLCLVSQNLEIFAQNQQTYIINFCSIKDKVEKHMADKTTDIAMLSQYMDFFEHNDFTKLIISVTYASVQKLLDVFENKNNFFDFIVWDEAHMLAGTSNMSIWFYKNKLSNCVEKQLFLTATPIILTLEHRKNKNQKFVSMDNKELFGNVIFNYSMRQGINEKYLADYNIIVPVASTIDIKTMFVYIKQNHQDIFPHNEAETDDLLKVYWRDLLNAFIIKDAFDRGCRKILSFSIYLKNAHMIAKLLHLLYRIEGEEIFCLVISHKTTLIPQLLKTFERTDKKAVILSSRVLTTGIDVPNVDAICISDPFQSEVIIKQMIGRGTRIHGDKVLNILLGVLAREDEDFDNSDFSIIRNVLFSLNSTDPSLIEQLQIIENKRLQIIGIKPKLGQFMAEEQNNITPIFNIHDYISEWRTQLLSSTEPTSTVEDKFTELIKWINNKRRVPRLMGPERRQEIINRGEDPKEVDIEAKHFWFMRDRKYENQTQDVKQKLNECVYYMKWIEKKEAKPIDKYENLIVWLNTNKRIPRKLNPKEREKLCAQGENMEELRVEQTFRNLIMDHKYDTLDVEVRTLLDSCLIYTQWRNQTTGNRNNTPFENKYQELVGWIEQNKRMPKVIPPAKRTQLINEGGNAEHINKEAMLANFMYEPKNQYANQPFDIKKILETCEIYMKWTLPSTVKEDNSQFRVRELIQWINKTKRMPRKLTGKRKEELFMNGENMDDLTAEMLLYSYNIKHKYENYTEDIRKLLDECVVYTNWRLNNEKINAKRL